MLQTTSALVLARGSPQVCLFRLNCCKMAEVMHVKYENGKVERIFLPQTVSDEFGVCTRLMWNTKKCFDKTCHLHGLIGMCPPASLYRYPRRETVQFPDLEEATDGTYVVPQWRTVA